MADKIAKFKQALKAQRTQPAETSSFEKEIQKYRHQPAKVASPKEHKSARVKTNDTHSNTASSSKGAKNPPERKSHNTKPANEDEQNLKGSKATGASNAGLRLTAHARSSKLIQSKEKPVNEHARDHKPGKNSAAQGNSPTDKASPAGILDDPFGSQTPPTNNDSSESSNYFKHVTTSIHKHVLSAESRPPTAKGYELTSDSQSSSQVMTNIMDSAKREAESMEICEHLSQEMDQLVSAVGEICQTVSWSVKHKSKADSRNTSPLSLFGHTFENANERASTLTETIKLDATQKTRHYSSPQPPSLWTSSDSIFEDRPLPTRKRPSLFVASPPVPKKLAATRSSPLASSHFSASPVSSSPFSSSPFNFESPPSLDIFSSQPTSDFFGFSRSQHSFSDMGNRKLFSEEFI